MKIIRIFELIRPKQWVKNLFVFAPILFAGKLMDLPMLLTNILAFASFCCVSSSVYVLNDIIDVESDRVHKKKRYRPIAAGYVSIKQAKILFVFLIVLTAVLSSMLPVLFLITISAYLVNNLLYSFKIKNVVLLDVFSISIGFILRVIAGAVAIDVSVSSWMIITTIFISLFLGISKRRAELSGPNQDNLEKQRKVLSDYDVIFVDQLNTIAATGTIISYALYTVSEKAVNAFHSDKLIYTTPFVLYGIFRYLYLLHQKNLGESPTQIVTKDVPIIINSLLWLITCAVIIYKAKFGF
ncbi:MAG: decaprenyl-phosphate phosphoribosyltransferase [Ignavibacteria bacterium]|nr:decaprenyl-phosphate phosphoribosyltransferase [Ignavibacteria bacterium]MBK7157354.1 decaprenyl-phosphate phosphoribosyltransferase [Ignavibacteria bacterium]MBK7255041.1 decaprenyl-phosphate phosphoribosyltransferase [Ignavibacteria bacterium]MBK7446762.1 decaprenyl-phosphate phosphoribosyltransferase [Ignavibacteria bacterium]MBK8380965.1 decaprenyl-phosphate phosphoribosyltransferase [Ignavibacteria bacterium]